MWWKNTFTYILIISWDSSDKKHYEKSTKKIPPLPEFPSLTDTTNYFRTTMKIRNLSEDIQ